MVFYICFTVIGVASAFLFYGDKKRAAMAAIHWSDMGKKYWELCDDPTMSSEKWREWLPIFEAADRLYAETHPHLGEFFRYAEAVKDEIDDLPCRGVGSL